MSRIVKGMLRSGTVSSKGRKHPRSIARARASRSTRKYSSTARTQPDWIIFLVVVALLIIGLIMVLDASIIEAYTQFSDKYHFIKLQAKWMGLGFIGLLTASFIPLKWIKKISAPLMLGTVVLLILVLIPGIGSKVQGARRWIRLGSFVLQPSELTKLAAVMYFPAWLTRHQRAGPFAAILGVITALLMLEPDLGTSIIIFIVAFSMYYLSGAPREMVAKISGAAVVLAVIMVVSSPYRLNRLKTFIDPTSDPTGTSYHIRQIRISLGSGGLTGTGFGRSRQKFQYLPEATTDSIFAVIGEETGFIGAMIVMTLFAIIIIRSLKLVADYTDEYAKLLAVGVVGWIGAQTALNLSAMVSLVPLTGVPLPFISYGGSSLVTTMAGVGLLLNSTRYRKRK